MKKKAVRGASATHIYEAQCNFIWLDHLITGDENRVMYESNHTRKRQWCAVDHVPEPTPKPELHPKKVMLSVCRDVAGVIHWDLLPTNTTVTSSVYTAQLERLKAKHKERRPGASKDFFLHNNARPHVAMVTKQKLKKFDWAILPRHNHRTLHQQIIICSCHYQIVL